jgi:hypothetical protein
VPEDGELKGGMDMDLTWNDLGVLILCSISILGLAAVLYLVVRWLMDRQA